MNNRHEMQGQRLRRARIAAGFGSARQAALSNNWKESTYRAHEGGSRTIGQDDAERYARAFRRHGIEVSARDILFGPEGGDADPPTESQIIRIMGRVGAGGDVDPELEQVPEDGIDQVELPTTAAIPSTILSDPIGFSVQGTSMYPRFNEGDILIVEREQPWPVDRMIGLEAVVLTDLEGRPGGRFVKRIMPGPKGQSYTVNLESIDRDTPTVIGVKLRWASPVRLIIPNVGLRRRSLKR